MADNLEVLTGESYSNPLIDFMEKQSEGQSPEPTTETPAVPATPEPVTKDWREIETPDDPEIHGFLRKKPLGEWDKSVREAERRMQAEIEARKLSEARAAAAETLNQMLNERLKQQPAPAAPAPQVVAEQDAQNNLDWVLDPEKSKKQLLDEAERRFNEKLEARDRAAQQAAEQRRAVGELQKKADEAAVKALTDLKIPQEHWNEVCDLVVPFLIKPGSEFAKTGGVFESENFKKVIEQNKIVKAGILHIVGTTPPPDPATPPGATKATPPPPVKGKAVPKLSNEAIRLAESMAKGMGITDPAELERFKAETADRLESNRRRKRVRD